MQIEARTEINATGKLKGFTFTGFDGEKFSINYCKTGLNAVRVALLNECTVYLKCWYNSKHDELAKKRARAFVVVIINDVLVTYQGTAKTIIPMLHGIPVREKAAL